MRKNPKHEPTDSYFYLSRQLAKCMTRADYLNLDIDTLRTEMTGTKQIPISHFCYTDEIKSKEFLADEKLLQVCSTDEVKSESVIVDESSTEESESESVHKSINKEKYAIDESDHEEPLVTDNPVVKDPRYFKLLKCGNNILNRLDATC